MNPLDQPYVRASMGRVPAGTYARDQADRRRDAEAERARRETLHGRAVTRRRKAKRGGKR